MSEISGKIVKIKSGNNYYLVGDALSQEQLDERYVQTDTAETTYLSKADAESTYVQIPSNSNNPILQKADADNRYVIINSTEYTNLKTNVANLLNDVATLQTFLSNYPTLPTDNGRYLLEKTNNSWSWSKLASTELATANNGSYILLGTKTGAGVTYTWDSYEPTSTEQN